VSKDNAVDLRRFRNGWFRPGRGITVRVIWYVVNSIIFHSPLVPISALKVLLLRLFGARVGLGVVIKPSVNIKFPWNIQIGDQCWIGEGVWLDSLGQISLGSNSCISQGAYICTGNHDWNDAAFGLIVKAVTISDGCWVGARSTILPGSFIESHAVICAGSVVSGLVPSYTICRGNPAVPVKERAISCSGTKATYSGR